jgi:putative peptidoglycan lipid II flippase
MAGRLIKSTLVTGSMTLVSRISGLVRDVVLASFIGASATVAADAFYVAFRIPNFFRRIFGEGAFSQSFVPVLSEYRSRDDAAAIRLFISHMSASLGLVLLAIVAAGMYFSSGVVTVLAPGFLDEPDKFAVTVTMLQITFPYLLFISLVAMSAGIMNAYHQFAVPAITPVLLNLCMIAAALVLAPLMDGSAVALAWGVFAAGIVQLLFQFPALKKMGMLTAPKPDWKDPGVRQVGKLMIPAIIGSSVAQINLLINTVLASFLVTGSVSWLYYSDRLMEFPLGIFGIALATVILPALSDTHHNRSPKEFSILLDWGLRWCVLIGLPASVALIILAEPLVATLFQYGAFTAYDVEMAGKSLVAFSVGLPGLILVKVLAPGFFARQDTRTPAKVAVISVSVNIVMSLLLFKPMAHVGLALAISIAAYVNSGLLFWYLRREKVFQPLPGWTPYIAKVLLACAVMGGLLFTFGGDAEIWVEAGLIERITRLFILVVAGIASFFTVVLITRIPVKEMLTDKRLRDV